MKNKLLGGFMQRTNIGNSKLFHLINTKKFTIHLAIWAVFIGAELLLLEVVMHDEATFGNYAIHYVLIISLFYFHTYVLLPKALGNRIFTLRFPIYVVAEFFVFCLVSFVVILGCVNYLGLELTGELTWGWMYFGAKLIRFFYFIAFSTGYFFFLRYRKEQKEKLALLQQQLEAERKHALLEKSVLQMENSMLKAQINPHFLHSSLDFVYMQSRKMAPVAAEAAVILSRIMRFSSASCDEAGTIALWVEIDQVKNLLSLYQLDEERNYHIQLIVDEKVAELKIIPLLLLTKVENMFQHADLQDPANPGVIHIEMRDGGLYIGTRNLIRQVKRLSGLGSGLNNIHKRIKYAYPEHSSFIYGSDPLDRYHETKLWIRLMDDGSMPSPSTSYIRNDRSSVHGSADQLEIAG